MPTVGNYAIDLQGDLGAFRATVKGRELSPGLYEVTLTLAADSPAPPPKIALQWRHPTADVHATWTPSGARGLSVNWAKPWRSYATAQMPVVCLHSYAGNNRLTFACSDALNPIELHAGVSEETATLECYVRFFAEAHPPIASYTARVLLDTRDLPYHEALKNVSEWWAAQPGYTPAPVPETARLPMYSTWYSFHQSLDTEEVIRQCRLAKGLGCEAIIVDDGWQTLDANRGYRFAGDWDPERIPDMRGFVDHVHEAGLKFLLWYGVPLMGFGARHFDQFKDKFIYTKQDMGCGYLDPRFPDVREYLITLYERQLVEWKLDGFKLDFVDAIYSTAESVAATGNGRDTDSLFVAADRLLSDVIARLRRIKPDIMIEFRQAYVGPLMRKYGNLFRASDCPNDSLNNRIRTLDIRLLAGNTPAHADMLMWHPSDPAESAALQFLAILFSVPQISVLIDRIPADHQAMLAFYLKFWRDHRDVLLDGALRPLHPESNYPVVIAETAAKRVIAVYEDAVAPLGKPLPEMHIVNATRNARVAVETTEPFAGKVTIFDCTGKKLSRRSITWSAGIRALPIPPAGLATIQL